MAAVFQMALKDLRILFRDKLGAFFIVGFPILMGVFFGLISGSFSSGGSAAMEVICIDQDQSKISQKFVDSLSARKGVRIVSVDTARIDQQIAEMNLPENQLATEREKQVVEAARQRVRKGRAVGMIVVPAGFGETAGIFWGDPPKVQIGMDPSRGAEAGMLQGFIMQAIGSLVEERFTQPDQFKSSIEQSRQELQAQTDVDPATRQQLLGFFQSVDSMLDFVSDLQASEQDADGPNGNGTGFQLVDIESLDVSREIDPNSIRGQLSQLRSRWDISFPQAMMWGVLGCVAGFSISIARERTLGTMLRLQVAPVSRFQILAGKALACFMTVIGVIVLLTILGVSLGMRPSSYAMLTLASVCVSLCFIGIMMTFSVLGKTEQSVSGAGWAINMIMAMFGGCMIPVMFMPEFMRSLSHLSPIKWGILAIEGAIWRNFSLSEMMLPCTVLVLVGGAGLALGSAVLSRR